MPRIHPPYPEESKRRMVDLGRAGRVPPLSSAPPAPA
jgi:hypothetical protein